MLTSQLRWPITDTGWPYIYKVLYWLHVDVSDKMGLLHIFWSKGMFSSSGKRTDRPKLNTSLGVITLFIYPLLWNVYTVYGLYIQSFTVWNFNPSHLPRNARRFGTWPTRPHYRSTNSAPGHDQLGTGGKSTRHQGKVNSAPRKTDTLFDRFNFYWHKDVL